MEIVWTQDANYPASQLGAVGGVTYYRIYPAYGMPEYTVVSSLPWDLTVQAQHVDVEVLKARAEQQLDLFMGLIGL